MADRLDLPSRHRRVLDALLSEHLPDVEVWAYTAGSTVDATTGAISIWFSGPWVGEGSR